MELSGGVRVTRRVLRSGRVVYTVRPTLRLPIYPGFTIKRHFEEVVRLIKEGNR